MYPPPFVVFWGDGLTCLTQHTGVWWTSHPRGWTGYHQGHIVKAIGSKTAASQTGRPPRNATKTNHEEREDTMNMRHAAPRNTDVATRRPLKRSSEIILAAVIYLTASCFAVVGTLGVVAAIWILWGALGVR